MCIIYPREDVRNQSEDKLPPTTYRSSKVFGKNIPLSLKSYQKPLMQPAARNGEEISHNALRKQPELCGRDSGLREENDIDEVFTRQMNCSFEEFLLKTFGFYPALPKATSASKKRRKKERGEYWPHAEVLKWRSVLKQNSLPKTCHSPVCSC